MAIAPNARCPHGVFPCLGEDRWIAIACWNDADWLNLATILGIDARQYPALENRLAAEDAIEKIISEITRHRNTDDLAQQLQYAGIEAVPVADFEDLLLRDPQLKQRGHFVHLNRSETGESIYERNGFRLDAATSDYRHPSPLLGEHTQDILRHILGLNADQIYALKESGAIE